MSERAKYPEWIDRFNSGEMTSGEKEHFLELIRNNEKLRLEVELDRQINEMLQDDDLTDLRKKMDQIQKSSSKIPRTYLLLAASLILLFSIGLFLMVESIRGVREKPFARSMREIYQHEAWAKSAKFSPNKKYEILLDMFTRSYDFEMILPKEAVFTVDQNIIFEWKTTSQKKVIIIIMNNAGEEISFMRASGNHALFPAENFQSGLFYYKIMQGNTLVILGKLIIKNK